MTDAWIQIAAGILVPYFVAGFVDFFFKERRKRLVYAAGGGWSDVPAYLKHDRGWHIWITAIWILLLLAAVFLAGWPWQILLGVLIFYTEDMAYYIFTLLFYRGTYDSRRFLPDHLPWLHGNIAAYIRIVGDRFPRRTFLRVYMLQWILLLTALLLFAPKL
jgi:hypothetical protein